MMIQSIRSFRKLNVYSPCRRLCASWLLGLALLACTPVRALSEGAEVRFAPYGLYQNGKPLKKGDRVGDAHFLFAYSLRADDASFGGLSGLKADRSRRFLLALSDRGRLFALEPHWEGKDLKSMEIASARWLNSVHGGPLEPEVRDTETLAPLRGGGYAVAFEAQHRVRRYDFSRKSPLPTDLRLPEECLDALLPNQGIEAMVEVEKGQLLAFSENPTPEGRILGWVWSRGKVLRQMTYPAFEDFRPTDAVQLPDGDVVVLERSYSILRAAQRARISVLPKEQWKSGGEVEVVELARFGWQSRIDNMEGLAMLPQEDGTIMLLLVSDDNFNLFQSTILVGLEYTP